MDRRNFLLAFMGAAGGGLALSSHAQAEPSLTLWDDLQSLETAAGAPEDLPAEGAAEAQYRRDGRRGGRRGPPARGRYRGRPPRGRAYGRRYAPPRRRRRVCRVVRTRYGQLVRRCWWVW
jgi:hypothetical protein